MSSKEDTSGPRNRKERRAAAKESGKHPSTSTLHAASHIPLSQPDRSVPRGKTLFDIAAERQELLSKGQPFDPKHGDGLVRDETGRVLVQPADDAPIGPLGEAFFLTTSLGMVHFTLDVLTFHQYAQDMEWDSIVKRSVTIYPVLFLAIYILHSKTLAAFVVLRQLFYLVLAIAAGCYMIYAGNTYDYFAVMKRAPPLGTLWIWSVVEMKLPYAAASVVVDLAYLFWNGYTMF